MRSATASAWRCPASAMCRPGARPGSTLPVVGVWPCRTRSTRVGAGLSVLVGAMVGGNGIGVSRDRRAALALVAEEVTSCRTCPRLVAWREQVAAERRAAFRDEEYWGRPVPGFGDPDADLMVVGLAPAAHGANRTG